MASDRLIPDQAGRSAPRLDFVDYSAYKDVSGKTNGGPNMNKLLIALSGVLAIIGTAQAAVVGEEIDYRDRKSVV